MTLSSERKGEKVANESSPGSHGHEEVSDVLLLGQSAAPSVGARPAGESGIGRGGGGGGGIIYLRLRHVPINLE